MINSVRNTVLSVLNKNNYGYISPSDFNLYAYQAQMELYEEYYSNYNKIINTIFRALISIHEPLLGKIRKYIPLLSGIDLSPVIVILLLSFLKNLITDYRLGL